jgi:glycosyltransferase involved in cell wall biosynthesis
MQQGGTEVLVQKLIHDFSSRHELFLVSGDRNHKALPIDIASRLSGHFYWDLRRPSRSKAKRLANALKRTGVALAHFHFGGTYEWAARRAWQCPVLYLANLSVPCLSTNHLAVEWLNCGVNPKRPDWQKAVFQWAAWVSRLKIYSKLRFEIAVSRHDQLRLQRMFPMFAPKIIQRYHSLLPQDAPAPELNTRDPVILCVGTIGGRKAQPNLAEAFASIAQKYPEWKLDLIGRVGEERDAQKIKGSAEKASLQHRIRLLGRLSDEETLQRMQRASIIAMPSLQEGLGLSLQEALFYGCVGVGTSVGGIPELIHNELNGLIVPPGNITALAAALDRLISNPELMRNLRSHCRSTILQKGMTAEAMVANYEQIYQNAS